MPYKNPEDKKRWKMRNKDKEKIYKERWLAGPRGQAYLQRQKEKQAAQRKAAPARKKVSGLDSYGTNRHIINGRNYRLRNRQAAIRKMGGQCAACGMDYWEVLQFDHIAPIGNDRERDAYKTVLKMENPDEIFQLLCANCHVVKTRINNEYQSKEISNASGASSNSNRDVKTLDKEGEQPDLFSSAM